MEAKRARLSFAKGTEVKEALRDIGEDSGISSTSLKMVLGEAGLGTTVQGHVLRELPHDLVPFSDVVLDFELPFRGRDTVMATVAQLIDANFPSRDDCSKEQVQFIAIEGPTGVGKTRFLLETKAGVEKELRLKKSSLASLHARGATAAVYMAFHGSTVSNVQPHFLPSAFVRICESRGSYSAGRTYMQASLVSQILYGKPWGCLPSGLQDEIRWEDERTSLCKVAAHVRDGLGAESDQMVALYLLLDEAQEFAREVTRTGCSGDDFLRGMLAWIPYGNRLAKDSGMAFITLLGGTVLDVGGRDHGVSDWLMLSKRSITLPPLDVDSAMEVLRLGVKDNRFEELRKPVQMLLEDCSCLPRLIEYACSAWKRAGAAELTLPAQDFIAHLRASVVLEMKTWVAQITAGNRETVKRMVQLCLTGAILKNPGTEEKEACFNGYVYAEKPWGVAYRSPRLLVHALGLDLGMPERVVALRPQAAVAGVLENGFLDMLHARLCVFRGQTVPVSDIFRGAKGSAHLLDTMLKVDEMSELSPTGTGFVFKCRKNVDGRVSQIGAEGTVYEFWLQLKGQEDSVSLNEATEAAQVAHSEKFKVEGKKKVYVLCSCRGFSFFMDALWDVLDALKSWDVLLLDLADFMPEFLRIK